ncbi:MAG: hypothetical protein PHR83_14050 [Paludibacter sp.]|nr:hypothetical protein [Paludibacter sp.]
MERTTSVDEARKIMRGNFIGCEELKNISSSFSLKIPTICPEIPYSKEYLIDKKDEYLLILGVSETINLQPLNLLFLRELFGTNPNVSEPCFYNQDWYMKEDFMNLCLENRWYLIKKTVFEDSRAELPTILQNMYTFPTAILCAYSFFAYWFHANEILWKYDFVWCSDKDHSGDRIYIGKYTDIDGVNKNGFSIHRHLALRMNYGCVNEL